MNDPQALQPEFDAYAGDYEAALQKGLVLSGEGREFFAAARIQWLARRLRELDFSPRLALDFGCGTGASMPLLLGLPGVESVAGVEVSARSLEVARRRHPSQQMRFSLLSDLQPAASFDLAFCNGVFHHIPPEQRPASLRYICDSLRAGGLFVFCENNPWNLGTRLIMKRIPFDRDAILIPPPQAVRLLKTAGFRVIHTDFLFFFPRMLAWFRALEPMLRRIPLGAQYMILAGKPMAPGAESTHPRAPENL